MKKVKPLSKRKKYWARINANGYKFVIKEIKPLVPVMVGRVPALYFNLFFGRKRGKLQPVGTFISLILAQEAASNIESIIEMVEA